MLLMLLYTLVSLLLPLAWAALVAVLASQVTSNVPAAPLAVRVHDRDTSPHHRHQSGRSWHFDCIHGQSYFLPTDRTGAATGEEAVFWAVHPVPFALVGSGYLIKSYSLPNAPRSCVPASSIPRCTYLSHLLFASVSRITGTPSRSPSAKAI